MILTDQIMHLLFFQPALEVCHHLLLGLFPFAIQLQPGRRLVAAPPQRAILDERPQDCQAPLGTRPGQLFVHRQQMLRPQPSDTVSVTEPPAACVK